MRAVRNVLVVLIAWAVAAPWLDAGEVKPIPVHRPELKLALERLKERTPRLPLDLAAPGEGPRVNNGLARRIYLPSEWFAADFRRDPAFTLDYAFKTRVFWIVSRGNNCHYCLGHQEHKLADAGMSDDAIAALDCRWDRFPLAEQATFAFARAMTLAPHEPAAMELESLRAFFNERELVELVYTIAFYNSVNRWTDALGLPQDHAFGGGKPIHFDQPTSAEFVDLTSSVIPRPPGARPAWENGGDVEAALELAKARQPRVVIPDDESTVDFLATVGDGELVDAQWARVLAPFGEAGRQQVRSLWAVAQTGRLSARLKAQLAYVAARENRAWYAVAHSLRWLKELEGNAPASRPPVDAMTTLEGEDAALAFAAVLTSTPQQVSDDHISALRRSFSDHEVAEIVYVVAAANFFDRFTETLGLRVEQPID